MTKGNCIIKVDKKYYRPTDVHNLSVILKSRKDLNWKPKISFET